LIEAKMKGLPVKPKQIASPRPVLDLMAALERSLAQDTGAAKPNRKAAVRSPANQPVAAGVWQKEDAKTDARSGDGRSPPPESVSGQARPV
jgi:hypothetical protein